MKISGRNMTTISQMEHIARILPFLLNVSMDLLPSFQGFFARNKTQRSALISNLCNQSLGVLILKSHVVRDYVKEAQHLFNESPRLVDKGQNYRSSFEHFN